MTSRNKTQSRTNLTHINNKEARIALQKKTKNSQKYMGQINNDNTSVLSSNNNSSKKDLTKQYKCRFKGVTIFKNRPLYITNTALVLYDNDKDRRELTLSQRTLLNSPHHNSTKAPRTTQSNLLSMNQLVDPLRSKTLINNKDRYNNNINITSNQTPTMLHHSQSHKVYQSPLKQTIPFYRELGIQKEEILNNILSSRKSRNHFNNDEAIKAKHSFQPCNSSYLKQIHFDRIPLICPSITSIQNDNYSESQKKRYISLMNQMLKVKFMISFNPAKEKVIIKEFLINNGIHNIIEITNSHLNNFASFLQSQFCISNIGRPIKEIIIDILINNNHTDSKKEEGKNDDGIASNANVNAIFYQKPSQSIEYTDMHNRFSLNKQQCFLNFFAKGTNNIVKGLETELNQAMALKKINFIKKTPSPLFSYHLPQSKSTVYLTQFTSCNNRNYINKGEDCKILLSNQNNMVKPSNSKNNMKIEDSKGVIQSSRNKKANVSSLNDKFFYSTYDKERTVDKVKSKQKLTELLVLEKYKRSIALKKVKEYFNDEIINKLSTNIN